MPKCKSCKAQLRFLERHICRRKKDRIKANLSMIKDIAELMKGK